MVVLTQIWRKVRGLIVTINTKLQLLIKLIYVLKMLRHLNSWENAIWPFIFIITYYFVLIFILYMIVLWHILNYKTIVCNQVVIETSFSILMLSIYTTQSVLYLIVSWLHFYCDLDVHIKESIMNLSGLHFPHYLKVNIFKK